MCEALETQAAATGGRRPGRIICHYLLAIEHAVQLSDH